MSKYIKQFFFVFSLFLLIGCGNKKDIGYKITKKKNEKELSEKLFMLKKNNYSFFYSKIGVSFKNSQQEKSFKATVKMRLDSAFSGTISVANFIGAMYLIDKDSIKVADKQKKCYFTGDLTYISSLIGVELDYEFFENLLLAKPIKLDESIKYKQIKDKKKQYYILSSHNKRKFKKIEDDKINIERDKNDNIFMQYYFTPDSLSLAKMHIEIPSDSVSIYINYVESKLVDGIKVPELTTMKIVHPKDSIFIQLDYGKVKLNQPKTIKFSVSKSYEICNQ